jgi:RNA polymerase sigma factor (sigma-70 family)
VSLEDQISSTPDPLDQILADESVKRLSFLLAQLDADKQEILRLRFAAELSFSAIAALENQKEAAVKMVVYRAIQWIREHWEADRG